MSSSITNQGIDQSSVDTSDYIAQMKEMANENSANTMETMKLNIQQQMTSAIASVGNNGAKNIAEAAKG